MRVRTILMVTLALCFLGVGVCFAYAINNDMNSDMNIGTWKLNEPQSKIPPGVTKNTTVVYESVGNDIKVTTDGTDKMASPSTPNGLENTTERITRSQAIPRRTRAPTRR